MAQRADARRNREALLVAAEEVFAAQGVGAPLEVVAARAGLGRGTLYRHFADRQALAVAVYDRRLATLEELAGRHRDAPDLLDRLVLGVAERVATVPGLVGVLQGTPYGEAALAELTERTRRLVSGPLAQARERGDVRPDVADDDLMLVFSMVEGMVRNLPPAGAHATVRRGCRLVLDGLRAGATAPRAAAPSTPGRAGTD